MSSVPSTARSGKPASTVRRPLLLILSSEIEPTDIPGKLRAPWGIERLIAAGREQGFDTLATYAVGLSVETLRREALPSVLLHGREIRPDAAIIRSMRGAVTMTRLADAALRARGCILLDPQERMDLAPLGKGELVLRAQGSGHDQDRHIVADRTLLLKLLRGYDYDRGGMLVVKPLDGYGGTDVRWVDGTERSIAAALEMAARGDRLMVPVIVERALDIVAEYRVYSLDGVVLGSVRRVPKGPNMPANAKQGATYLAEDPPAEGYAAMRALMVDGLVGWDLAFTRSGPVIVIETNRPPVWKIFAQTTGIDIGALVVARLKERLAQSRAVAGT